MEFDKKQMIEQLKLEIQAKTFLAIFNDAHFEA